MASLKDIISYSKANPNTDYAKRAGQLIKSGGFDAQAQKEGIDLSWAGRPPLQKVTGSIVKQKVPGILTETAQNLGGQYNDATNKVTSSITGGAQDLANATESSSPIERVGGSLKALGETALGTAAGGVQAIFAPISAPIQTLLSHITAGNAAHEAAGNHDITDNIIHSPQADAARKAISDWSTAHPELARTLGDAFTVGTAALGSEAADSVLNKPVSEVASDAVSKIKGVASNLKSAVTTDPEAAAAKSIQTSVQDTMPLQDKNERIDALRNSYPNSGSGSGGVSREGILGKSTTQPTAEDIQRGTVADEYVKNTSDPVKKIQNVNQGIKDTSVKVDDFLNKNAAPANFADMRDYLETNRPTSILQKDPGAIEAYNRSTQNALDTLYKTMKDSASETGDFGANTSGADIRQARIKIDKQITDELGENTFGTPQYKGIKAAEIDTRNLLNRMSEDMLRYPGQMEELNKMNDFINQAKGRGIEVDMSDPEVKANLEKRFGLKTTPEDEANAQQLANQHQKMSKLYEARDNMIDKYQTNVGKNKIQTYLKQNPGKAKVIKRIAGGTAIGLGIEHFK